MERDENGFTLIELMVVISIVAVLIAIAVPTILGFRNRANDTSAKESAAFGMRVARTLSDRDAYASVTLAMLSSAEPSLTFVDGTIPSTGNTVVSQVVPDLATTAKTFVVSVYSESGTCFLAKDVLDQGTTYGVINGAAVGDCRADNAGAAIFGSSW